MDNKISTYSPAFSIVSWIALVGGIVTYLLGLWNAEMQLNEKGYYFAVLNRPGFPGECFICELRLPDHRFRWKH
uniref:YiaA/YiaB family inner membrane protein n=1 Tax=Escherichia coli TaxID=562 RepID=UPI001FCE8CF8